MEHKFRIAKLNGLFQPQTLITYSGWFHKTSRWIPITRQGIEWQKSYVEALDIIEKYKTPTDNKIEYIYLD
jgi:hypothetical protein